MYIVWIKFQNAVITSAYNSNGKNHFFFFFWKLGVMLYLSNALLKKTNDVEVLGIEKNILKCISWSYQSPVFRDELHSGSHNFHEFTQRCNEV